MGPRRARLRVLLAAGALMALLGPLAPPASARPQGYRWVDEQGVVHYAGSLDEVPEAYRPLFGKSGSGAPARTPPPSPRAASSTASPLRPVEARPPAPTPPTVSPPTGEPAPDPSRRRGWWIVVTPEGYFRTLDEERCRRIADSAAQRFRQAYRCAFESYD